jgi:peptide deformylase
MQNIVQYGDPVLTEKCSAIETFDSYVSDLVEELKATLVKEEKGIAVAAPQIGIPEEVFVYDLNDQHGPRVIINPNIYIAKDSWMFKEGCLSIRDMFWWVSRPKDIGVTWQDEKGVEQRGSFTELEARMFQHEIDHLRGVLLLSRITPSEKKKALKELAKRNQGVRTETL